MELTQCLATIYKQGPGDLVEISGEGILFQAGYVYPAFRDENGLWLTTDEDNEMHVIAEHPDDPALDPWFNLHFKKV
ncbi:hypothetical protein B0H94_107197 [Salsuginibacillus halophilus]|uniref:Uncharacterized protein n=1 Tax=Salsuginibacillus halophilus TaxID=517424 RepID=A0A2P8HG42_9BACI|nr:hypothetical protein [Salsuginibacillus halophilus]PSL45192.1 hypothetical protein B0H94_107197 [Salsuginibacillus halophilus]